MCNQAHLSFILCVLVRTFKESWISYSILNDHNTGLLFNMLCSCVHMQSLNHEEIKIKNKLKLEIVTYISKIGAENLI